MIYTHTCVCLCVCTPHLSALRISAVLHKHRHIHASSLTDVCGALGERRARRYSVLRRAAESASSLFRSAARVVRSDWTARTRSSPLSKASRRLRASALCAARACLCLRLTRHASITLGCKSESSDCWRRIVSMMMARTAGSFGSWPSDSASIICDAMSDSTYRSMMAT